MTIFDRDFKKAIALMTDEELAETLLAMQKGEQSAENLPAADWYSNRIEWCIAEQDGRRDRR